MKQVFLGLLVLTGVLWVLAQVTAQHEEGMRWATDANPARDRQVAEFNTLYRPLKVRIDPGLGGDQTKLIVQCSTGTGPDIIDIYGIEQMNSFVQAGILMDLTEAGKKMGFGLADTYPSAAGEITVEGRQYRFPCNVGANGVIYNKAIFDDHGVAYPKPGWTYDDFIETCRQLRENPSKSGAKPQALTVANWGPSIFVTDLLMGFDGRFYTPDGLHSALDQPEALATMRFYRDLLYRYHAFPSSTDLSSLSAQGGWGSTGVTLFSDGRAAMLFIGRWYIVNLPQYPNLRGKLGSVQLPSVPGQPSRASLGSRGAGINAKGAHQEQAMKFLQYLASPEYGRLIAESGDALPPNPALARIGADLVNKVVPDPAFHQTFIDAVKSARAVDTSPYIDAGLAQSWFSRAIDSVDKGADPEATLRSLAREINQTIQLNIERRPDLRRKVGG